MTEDWSNHEVSLIVADYFAMLEIELKHQPLNKAAHRKALLPHLNGRSNGSVEFKHQNISAVLAEMGHPYIKGYKPKFNYQQLLEEHVTRYLNSRQALLRPLFEEFVTAAIPEFLIQDINVENWLEEAPKPAERKHQMRSFKTSKINYLEKEQHNRILGSEGEQSVLQYEKWRLNVAGRSDLINHIVWVAKEKGDGAGYDILSKNEDGSDRYIEVKTTKLSKESPIYVTANEVAFAEKYATSFFLYRVFEAASRRKLFIHQGSYAQFCQLEAVTYKGIF